MSHSPSVVGQQSSALSLLLRLSMIVGRGRGRQTVKQKRLNDGRRCRVPESDRRGTRYLRRWGLSSPTRRRPGRWRPRLSPEARLPAQDEEAPVVPARRLIAPAYERPPRAEPPLPGSAAGPHRYSRGLPTPHAPARATPVPLCARRLTASRRRARGRRGVDRRGEMQRAAHRRAACPRSRSSIRNAS